MLYLVKMSKLKIKIDAAELTTFRDNLLAAADLDSSLANGWTLFDYQKDSVRFIINRILNPELKGYLTAIVALDMGVGKATTNTTKVLTPSGWMQMSDLKVGDFVIGSEGTPTEILGVYPQGKLPIYRVTFTDDTFTDCCKDHLWSVLTPCRKYRRQSGKVFSVEKLLESGLRHKSGNLKYSIPMVKPVEFPKQDLPLHPYVLGVLLGDGCFWNNQVTWSKSDLEIAKRINCLIHDSTKVHTLNKTDKDYSVVHKPDVCTRSVVLNSIRNLGLPDHKSNTKFIPDIYKFGSTQDRLDILQGILDTDGSVFASGHVIDYGSTSKQLCLDVQFLVESFGGTAKLAESNSWVTYKEEVKQKQHFYRLNISLPENILPFWTSCKASIYEPNTKYQPSRGIKSIDLLETEEECTCITVAASDNLYVIDHCIVTHNTIVSLTAARAMKEVFDCKIVVICPATLIDNWKREASYLPIDIEVYSYNKQPKDINYPNYFLIADEAHNCQSSTSIRTKTFTKLAASSNCKGALLLSGSPMKNGRPCNLFPLLKIARHPIAKVQRTYEYRYCAAHATPWSHWDVTGSSHLDELHQKIQDVMLIKSKEECLDLPDKVRIFYPVQFSAKANAVYKSTFNQIRDDYLARVKKGEISIVADAMVILGQLRRAASIAKVEAALELATEALDQGHSVVLFTDFVDTAKALHQVLKGELLTGQVPVKLRQGLVDRFQSGESKVFVSTIEAGGVGITLTKADICIMVDRSWVPGMALQSEDRLYRVGQVKKVIVYWLQGGSIDTKVDKVLIDKSGQIELVMRGERKTLKGVSVTDIALDLLADELMPPLKIKN